jgi:lipoyl(octanoyl) transferase
MTSLKEALGRRPGLDETIAALRAGFTQGWGVSLEPADLTTEEKALAEELRQTKYASDDWNLRL